MIKLENVKEASKWMMVVGGSIFACGFGTNFVCNYIAKKDAKKLHELELMKIEEENLAEKRKLDREKLKAATAKDLLYSEKLKDMDSKAFAKFHADKIAKANEDVMAKAELIRKQAEAEVTKTKLECNDTIEKLRTECLEKIQEANAKRDEAIEKYEAIDSLFTNKKEILAAKEYLEAAVKKDQKAKNDKEELLKSIKDILE